MKKKTLKHPTNYLLLILLSLIISSCEVEIIPHIDPDKNEEIENDNAKGDSTANEGSGNDRDSLKNNPKAIIIGNGSGSLQIKDIEGKKYTIKAGNYSNIDIINVKSTELDGLNKVTVRGGTIYISNVEDVKISGITLHDHSQPVINIYDRANDLILSNLTFRNIRNKVINFTINRKYDGTKESYSNNIVLDSLVAENTGPLFESNGGYYDNNFFGLIKNFKLTNSTIKNSPDLGNGIYVNLAEGYEISNNTVNNINSNSTRHNGIFHLKGSGKIFNNKITNHQGNAVRAWIFKISDPNATVEIHDNIVYNSLRYSAFEVQVTPDLKQQSTFSPINARVYNNTVGKLNTGEPKYYEGRVVDIYSTYGVVEVFNNLFFNMRDNIVSLNQSDSDTRVKESNNKYFKSERDAVIDLINFKSKISNIGANRR